MEVHADSLKSEIIGFLAVFSMNPLKGRQYCEHIFKKIITTEELLEPVETLEDIIIWTLPGSWHSVRKLSSLT